MPANLRGRDLVNAVAAGQPRQVVETEVIGLGSRVAPPGLEQADRIRAHVGPEALVRALGVHVGGEILVPVHVRHGQVSGQQVEQGGDVGGALDRGVSAQRENAAPGPADVAEQQLEDGGGADVLHADGVLGPADAVDERRGAVGARILRHELADPGERVRRHAAGLLDHLRGVAREMPLQHLEHAPRRGERLVPVRVPVRRGAARAVRLPASRLAHLPMRGPAVVSVVSSALLS